MFDLNITEGIYLYLHDFMHCDATTWLTEKTICAIIQSANLVESVQYIPKSLTADNGQ